MPDSQLFTISMPSGRVGDDQQTAMWPPLYIIIGVMVAQMGVKAVVTAVEMATGSEGVYYRALEMTVAMALTKVGRNGGGC